MNRKVTIVLGVALVVAFALSFSVNAATATRGGVTPHNLPWNKHPDPNPTIEFKTPEVSADSLTKLAVLVGINDYYGTSSDLQYCVNDINDVYSALTTKYGFPSGNIYKLTDSQATDANIRAAINWLVANSTSSSTAVFYYSGHGSYSTTCKDGDGIARDYCIVPYELSRLWDYPLSQLFNPLSSTKVWIGFDSCFSGGLNRSGITKAGRVCTFACSSSEYSYESGTVGHGYFTYLTVHRGMLGNYADSNGDGHVTVEEAFNYCKNNIGSYTSSQHPVMNDQYSGDLWLSQ